MITIKRYQSNLEVFKNGECNFISFDGQAGLFTEQEWRESDLEDYTNNEQTKILDVLESTSNIDFFV